jgi:DNA helicase-2/ATP-dependent DNA helicase PcrA
MNEVDQEYEIRRLNMVLQQIQLRLKKSRANLDSSRGELYEALEEFWDNPKIDFWDQSQLVEVVERQRSLTNFSEGRLLQYVRLASSPYFGRIDFTEDGQTGTAKPEMIYIGIATLTDSETGNCLIYDWRSPVAGMFYDYELGNCQYQCPAGLIHGKITLKRQYKIKKGRMEYMFDADVKIDDEVLQELLGKSVDDKMRTIVNTIQREQNQVIRDETHPVLMVMGPAGSGKTSVALHRAAYLLYRDRERITSKNILILSPNRIFGEYISDVLPELGEENVRQSTFGEYFQPKESEVPVHFEDFTDQMEYLLAGPKKRDFTIRITGIHYKFSAEFMRVIDNYLAYLRDGMIRDYPALDFRGQIFFTKDDWQTLFYKNLAYLPLTERLRKIRRRIQIQMRPLVRELRREKEELIASTGEEVNERDIKALARMAARQELIPLTDKIEKMTIAEPLLLFRRLYEDPKLFQRLTAGTEVPARVWVDWPEICQQSLNSFATGTLLYEDAVSFMYFEGCLTGFSTKTDIRHVIVDEAQDYNCFQFAILKRLFPKCSWTILGDPDQKVNPYQPVIEFSKIADVLGGDRASAPSNAGIIRLQKSYRSTWEIQSFAWAIMGRSDPANHLRRPGPCPQVIKTKYPAELPEFIIETIQQVQKEGWRSIAVIAKTALESKEAYEVLRERIPIKLLTYEMEKFYSGLVLLPVYLAKGLEFDAVLIYDVSEKAYPSEEERGLLYVACTRALHRLFLFCDGELSSLVTGITDDLYERVLIER